MIEFKINVNTVGELHKACNEILNGYGSIAGKPVEVIANKPADDLMDYEPGKSVETATEQAGSTETATLGNAGASHPPIPDNATGTPIPDNVTSINEGVETAGPRPELDHDGLPWDERIHSSKKSQTKGNTWKILRIPKRFNDDEAAWHAYVTEIKAEQRLANYDKPGKTLHEQTETENPDPNSEFNPPAGQQAANTEPVTFDDVIKFLADVADHSIVMDVCEALNLVNVFELEKKPELIADFYSRVNALVTLDE